MISEVIRSRLSFLGKIMALSILRTVFLAVSVGIAVLIFNSPFLREAAEWIPWAVLGGMVFLPLAIIGIDASIRSKDLTVITAIYFGLIVGAFLTYIAILALTPILPTNPRSPVLVWLPLILGMILCYVCTSLLLQTRSDFRFLIPYVEFARNVQGLRPNLLDTSAIVDGRIADLATSGIFESRFVVPSFIVDELQSAADSSDKQRRLRGRRGLDILSRLRASPEIHIEVAQAKDTPDAQVPSESRMVEMASRLGGRIVTNDPNTVKLAALRAVPAININDIAVALKPTFTPGDLLDVRLLKSGEEAGQAVGYLDDGTMIVVEGGRDQIGRMVNVSVTSTLQTTAGRLVFAKPEALRSSAGG